VRIDATPTRSRRAAPRRDATRGDAPRSSSRNAESFAESILGTEKAGGSASEGASAGDGDEALSSERGLAAAAEGPGETRTRKGDAATGEKLATLAPPAAPPASASSASSSSPAAPRARAPPSKATLRE
jgi:septal ring-binding cell division protein DamX